MLESILFELNSLIQHDRIPILQNFFQTHTWGYGEGDKFLGLYVPQMRKIAKKYHKNSTLDDIKKLLTSEYHEHRFTWLVMLNHHFESKKPTINPEEIFRFYLQHIPRINNWDLVDVSAPNIIWWYLVNKEDRKILDKLITDKLLRKRRAWMVSTLRFIRNEQVEDTLRLSEKLLKDEHHLIHKATGRMLREARKKSPLVVEDFLDGHKNFMPRTMLRYTIEMMSEEKRKKYLQK